MSNKVCVGCVLILILACAILPFASAEMHSLDPCGQTVITEQGIGGNAEWVMENGCVRLEMRKNTYDPNTEIYDKLNDRYFRLMANQLEERNNAGVGQQTTTLTSMGLTSDVDEGYIRWRNANTEFGYALTGATFKIVANITNWAYSYGDSDLWLDIRFHKNEGDILEWIPALVDNVEIPIETETRTAGKNTFIAQKIGRGTTIIIDPLYTVDYSPEPALRHIDGDDTKADYSTYASTQNVTTVLSDNNISTGASVERNVGVTDDVIRLRFNQSYSAGHYYFLRLQKRFGSIFPQQVVVYPHINSTHINLSSYALKTVTGSGWFNIPINILVEQSSSALGYVDLRLSETTDNFGGIIIAEVRLRDEVNDTQAPTIHSCWANANNLTCNETATFTCNITDNQDVDNATFTINNTDYNATMNGTLWYVSIMNTAVAEYNLTLTNVTACDLFNNCTSKNQSVTIRYNCWVCTENWIAQYTNLTACQTNNTLQQQKTYYDNNSCGTNNTLPSDNGTISEIYCNYCDPNWQELTGGIHECQSNSTRYVEYFDYNNCYVITNLSEDAPPMDHEIWVSCTFYTQQFNCSMSDVPYINKKIEYTCTLPYTGTEYECINKVSYEFDEILQVNPQKVEKTTILLGFNPNIESREHFTTTFGLLNAYYTNKNIIGDTPFVVTTICSKGNNTLIYQQQVIPEIRSLQGVMPIAIWAKENAGYILFSVMLLVIVALFIGYLYRKARDGV